MSLKIHIFLRLFKGMGRQGGREKAAQNTKIRKDLIYLKHNFCF